MWFLRNSLPPLTDAATYSRAVMLTQTGAVLPYEIIHDERGNWHLRGSVQGSQRQPYLVMVELRLSPDGQNAERWKSTCSCPVGSQCKHGMAMLLDAALLGQHKAIVALETRISEMTEQLSAPDHAQMAAARWEEEQQRQFRKLVNQAQDWLQVEKPSSTPSYWRSSTPATPPSPLYLLSVYEPQGRSPQLCLALYAATLRVKGGGWTKPKSASPAFFLGDGVYNTTPRDQALTPTDREILDLFNALPNKSALPNYGFEPDRLLNGTAAPWILQRAASTGRLFVSMTNGGLGPAIRLGPDVALSWHWTQEASPASAEPLWRLHAEMPNEETVLYANRPQMLYLNVLEGLCGLIENHGTGHDLLKTPPLPESLMLAQQPALMARLGAHVPLPPALPPMEKRGGPPIWRLRIAHAHSEKVPAPYIPSGALEATLAFDYEGIVGLWPSQSDPEVLLDQGGVRVHLTRDLPSERAANAALEDLGLCEWKAGVYCISFEDPQTPWLHWADDGFAEFREKGFALEIDDDLQNWLISGDELRVEVLPTDPDEPETSPWFELSLGLELEGQRVNVLPWLPDLIRELHAQDETGAENPYFFVPSPDGERYIRIAIEPLRPWLTALLELFDDRHTDFSGENLRLSRLEALRTRVSLGEGVAWQGAQQLSALAQQLRGQTELPSVPAPAGLCAELRPYQLAGVAWLQFLRTHQLAGILADDMGLGKTLQTLAHILVEKQEGRLDRPALVVAPVSLLGTWQREATRFCPALKTLVLHGLDRHDRADDISAADIVIAPYSLLHRDRQRWVEQAWHLVVLDEAQNIKNAATQAAQVVAELNTRHRLCLSGTPIENHLGEIWSLFHFLMPGFLGSQQRFSKRFRNPIEKQGDTLALQQLRARLTPFILRRTKDLVAHELPPKVETVVSVELTGKQADLYETIRLSMEKAVRNAIAEKGLARSQIVFLDALLKLRQVCCDPRMVKTEAAAKVKSSAKLARLLEMLPEMVAEGRRVLLFSQFTSMLSLIEEALKQQGLQWVKLTGQTQNRDAVIEQFTEGKVPIFLISLKAGGVGLNLPQADTVIHFDPWWNPAAENQATDRAHRIGQTQSVWVIKLVAQGTIEERILALQARKAELARELYSGATARKQPLFTEDDVRALLEA